MKKEISQYGDEAEQLDEQADEQVSSESKRGLFAIPSMLKQKLLSSWSHVPYAQEIERKMDHYFNRTLAVLDIPSREEVADLQQRLNHLLNRCEAMVSEKSADLSNRTETPSESSTKVGF